jgi:hypothetical protein
MLLIPSVSSTGVGLYGTDDDVHIFPLVQDENTDAVTARAAYCIDAKRQLRCSARCLFGDGVAYDWCVTKR